MIIKNITSTKLILASLIFIILFSCKGNENSNLPNDNFNKKTILGNNFESVSDTIPQPDSLTDFWNGLKIEKKEFFFNNSKLFSPMSMDLTEFMDKSYPEIRIEDFAPRLTGVSVLSNFEEIYISMVRLINADSKKFDNIRKFDILSYFIEIDDSLAQEMAESYKTGEVGTQELKEKLLGKITILNRLLYKNEPIAKYYYEDNEKNMIEIHTLFNLGRLCPPICPDGIDESGRIELEKG